MNELWKLPVRALRAPVGMETRAAENAASAQLSVLPQHHCQEPAS